MFVYATLVMREMIDSLSREQLFHNGMPEGLTVRIQREERRDDHGGLDRFDPFRGPVDIGEAEPEREFVERQREGDAKDDRDAKMPLRRARGERDEAREHEEHDAPEQMVDVQAAFRDQVSERPVRKHVEMNDRRHDAKHQEGNEERDERSDRYAATEIQTTIVMPQPHVRMIAALRWWWRRRAPLLSARPTRRGALCATRWPAVGRRKELP
jgi:hypothetical protein